MRSDRHRNCQERRAGLTLIEVAFSMAMVATAVVATFMLLPAGIRTQTSVRFKALAAAKAMELIDLMSNGAGPGIVNDGYDMDKEGIYPWDSPVTYKPMAPDLESYLESMRSTVKPLPEPIARRLDSDNDEIQRLLDAGGRLYYCVPNEAVGTQFSPEPVAQTHWEPLYRKLLIGVVGLPQQNAILYHPSLKVGPYQEWYPSPPRHVKERALVDPTGSDDHHRGIFQQAMDYEAMCRDPQIQEVLCSTATYNDGTGTWHYGYKPYDLSLHNAGDKPQTPDFSGFFVWVSGAAFDRAKRANEAYVAIAMWYCIEVAGIPQATLQGLSEPTAAAFALANSGSADWKKVLGMRYLAHAAASLPRYYPAGFPGGGALLGGSPSVTMMPGATDFTTVGVTIDNVRGWHEAALRLGIAFADKNGPYDWGAPRSLNRQVMMDHPLIELDCWSDPITATYPANAAGTFLPYINGGQVVQRQWKALYPEAIVNPGLPYSFPGRAKDTDGDGVVDLRDGKFDGTHAWDGTANRPWEGSPWTEPASYAAPPHTLDTNADGVLDDNDSPVPLAAGTVQKALGPKRHFNLTAPFDASERCRQLVVWAVDWQSYQDFETCPSALIDASRYPIVGPAADQTTLFPGTDWYGSSWCKRNPLQRQLNVQRAGPTQANATRNPELTSLFREPSVDPGTGLRITDLLYTVGEINNFGGPPGPNGENQAVLGQAPDIRAQFLQAALPAKFGDKDQFNMNVFLGRFGCNRDAVESGTLPSGPGNPKGYPANSGSNKDRPVAEANAGTLSPSVRLRAQTVCVVNFYDPRIQGTLNK